MYAPCACTYVKTSTHTQGAGGAGVREPWIRWTGATARVRERGARPAWTGQCRADRNALAVPPSSFLDIYIYVDMCMSLSLSINHSFYLSTYVDVYITYIRSQACDTQAQHAQLHGSAPGRARCMRHPPTHADTHTYMHGHAYIYTQREQLHGICIYVHIHIYTHICEHTYILYRIYV